MVGSDWQLVVDIQGKKEIFSSNRSDNTEVDCCCQDDVVDRQT